MSCDDKSSQLIKILHNITQKLAEELISIKEIIKACAQEILSALQK